MGRDPSWDRRGPPLGVRDRRRPIFRGLLRALRRRQQTPIPIAAPESGVRSAQASASGAGRPSWLGGDCGTIDDCRGGILADRGGDRARVIGSNERQDAMAGVEYQRCFLAQAAGIQTRPVTQRGAAPDPAPSGERPDGYPAHLTNGLIRNALGTPWKVVPVDEHRIGGALDPAILVQGVHWLTLRSLAPWTARLSFSARRSPGQKGRHRPS